MDGIVNIVESSGSFGVKFGGAVFHVEEMLNDIITVLLASTVLLFIILVVQFESFWLPLIILIEIPIDIAGAFIFLQAFQSGINVMSLLGIVVMGGIIINDSILKIDVINEKRSQGLSLVRSVISGGKRRFKSIIMTSLTTVLGMIPLIFTSGLGAELQAPLVLALAGGMIIGTMVSLYIIPLCYLQFIGNGPAKK